MWETYRKLVAKSLVLLTVALSDGDRIVVVLVVELIISYVPHTSKASATVQVVLEKAFNTGPHLDSGSVTGIRHGNVVDVQVLHNIDFALVLAQRADTDTMRAIADKVLDNCVGAIGLEGYAICDCQLGSIEG